ncbi:hypothetical protein QQS21_005212 [Conoideocrella luteorostrata]|uniref:Uncharacterized protein n=1 Tax=Conoideocrella luteorostrata TaxID=1105319 RepID=A0AAJ0CPV0_9HYPO|nr:hypothetical protein QQS21_005212 [Conoideocrella luteorostrata]
MDLGCLIIEKAERTEPEQPLAPRSFALEHNDCIYLEEEARSSKSFLLENSGSKYFKGYDVKAARLYCVIISLALLCGALLAGLIVVIRQKQAMEPKRSASWLPPEALIETIFRPDTAYGGEQSKESEKAWMALMPKGMGIVTVQNTLALPDAPKLDPTTNTQDAMISVYHQLHCLYRTRSGYFTALSGNVTDMDLGHLSHCWDYLRQSIMCSADTTLEWLEPPEEHGTTGWGYQHKCRDFSAISSWAEENRHDG